MPWFGLPGLFQDADGALAPLIAAAAGTAASPIVTVNLWLDRQVLPDAVRRPARPDDAVGLRHVADSTNRTTPESMERNPASTPESMPAGHLSLVSSGAEAVLRQSNDELIALAWRELREPLPAAAATPGCVRATVVREPQASFSLAPGQPARPGTRTAVPGLLLAGDWVDTGLPATIESAVVSGHRAADDILSGRAQDDASARRR